MHDPTDADDDREYPPVLPGPLPEAPLTTLGLIERAHELMAELDEVGEDDEAAFFERIHREVVGPIEQKLEALHHVVARFDAEAAIVAAETDRLTHRRARLRRDADRLRILAAEVLIANELVTGDSHVQTPTLTSSLRRTPFVDIVDATALPADCIVQPPAPPPRPDKVAIKAALKAGRLIPGAQMGATTTVSWK